MITEDYAGELVRGFYGVSGCAKRLAGECDLNFHIQTENGEHFVLKLSQEQDSIILMQNELLTRLEAAQPSFVFPILQRTQTGQLLVQLDEKTKARLFSYLPGSLLAHVQPHSHRLLANLGTQVAHLSLALKQITHPAAKRYIKWDLQQALWIEEYLPALELPQRQGLVESWLKRFRQHTLPNLQGLPMSLIHGDLNDYNILVADEDKVSGFIDFGDAVYSYTVCELAITMAYALMNKPDPLDAAVIILQHYHQMMPLTEQELDLLWDLIGIRLCMSVVNSALRKKEQPQDAYLVISEQPAWNLLMQLQDIKHQDVMNLFLNVCELPNA